MTQVKKRNRNAGVFKGKSESSKYFAENPEARKKKNEYNKKYHSTEKRKAYRAELNAANRKRGSKPGDGMDLSHTKSGGLVKEKASTNRARNGQNGKSTKKKA